MALTSQFRSGNVVGEEGRLPSPPRSVKGQKKELLLARWTAASVLFSWWYRSFIGVCAFGKMRTNSQFGETVCRPGGLK